MMKKEKVNTPARKLVQQHCTYQAHTHYKLLQFNSKRRRGSSLLST